MHFINRLILKKIESTLFKGKIIILYGPRQVGKTTLVKHLIGSIEGSLYVSCDDPSIRERLEYKNTAQLEELVRGKKLIVIDEAQLVRDIGLTLKIIHDTYPDVQIIATGSSSFDLANKIKEPLTGRAFEYLLLPLAFQEIVGFKDIATARALLESNLIYGSYPEVLFGAFDKKELLGVIAQQYLYKDILKYEGIRMPDMLEKLLKLLAASIGSEVSYNELANTLDVSRQTIENYINILEQAFIVFKVRPYFPNMRSQVSKKSKIYFYDLGMRNAILGNFSPLALREDKGALFENYVVVERRKVAFAASPLGAKQYFWRTYNGQEIDLIEERFGEKARAFEIKYGDNYQKKTSALWKDAHSDVPLEYITASTYPDFV